MRAHKIHIMSGLILLFLYAVLSYIAYSYGCFNVEAILIHRDWLLAGVMRHYYWAVLLFITCFIVHGASALPATSALIIMGGFLFGTGYGSLYSLIALLGGGTIAFMVSNYMWADAVARRYGTQLNLVRAQLKEAPALSIIFIRLVPIIPFCFANVACGLARISRRLFWITLLIGISPSVLLYSMLGAQLGSMRALDRQVTSTIMGILCCLMLLTLCALFCKKRSSSSVNNKAF